MDEAILRIRGNCQLCSDTVTMPIGERGRELNARVAQKAYGDSMLFATASNGTTGMQAEIKIAMMSEHFPSTWKLLAELTSGVIPLYLRYTLTRVTVFRSSSGQVIGTIEKVERYSRWVSPLLLPILHFLDFPKVFESKVFYDLHRATLQEAVAQGII